MHFDRSAPRGSLFNIWIIIVFALVGGAGLHVICVYLIYTSHKQTHPADPNDEAFGKYTHTHRFHASSNTPQTIRRRRQLHLCATWCEEDERLGGTGVYRQRDTTFPFCETGHNHWQTPICRNQNGKTIISTPRTTRNLLGKRINDNKWWAPKSVCKCLQCLCVAESAFPAQTNIVAVIWTFIVWGTRCSDANVSNICTLCCAHQTRTLQETPHKTYSNAAAGTKHLCPLSRAARSVI